MFTLTLSLGVRSEVSTSQNKEGCVRNKVSLGLTLALYNYV